jgi:hypothetical protein
MVRHRIGLGGRSLAGLWQVFFEKAEEHQLPVKRLATIRSCVLPVAVAAALWPQTAKACAVCYGKSDSALAQGMNMGILSLLVVVVLMWAGFASFFIYLARKSAATSVKNQAASISVPETTNSVR